MKHPLFLLTLSLIKIAASAQTQPAASPIDSALAKKITLNGVCLCRTTIADLQKAAPDLRLVEVEEMDLGKRCTATDSRYENGQGYSSGDFPGMIFQKADGQDYIGNIRLTRGFHGRLPNGSTIDMDIPDLETESTAAYILNGKWITKDQELTLSKINDTNFRGLQIIDGETLKNTYNVNGKTLGVVIRSTPAP